jgi:hypothetical protein
MRRKLRLNDSGRNEIVESHLRLAVRRLLAPAKTRRRCRAAEVWLPCDWLSATEPCPPGTGFLDTETGPLNRRQRRQTPAETKISRCRRRKSPHKPPIRCRRGNLRFVRTGWWRQDGSKLNARHPVIERVSKLSQEREFSMQRLSDETGLFAASLPAETAQIRELGAHVFDIFIVRRVRISSHNQRE